MGKLAAPARPRLTSLNHSFTLDLVICCRAGADEAMDLMRNVMSRLKLTVNESKTRVCRLPEEKFDFLGYTFGRCYSPASWINIVPSSPAQAGTGTPKVLGACGSNPLPV